MFQRIKKSKHVGRGEETEEEKKSEHEIAAHGAVSVRDDPLRPCLYQEVMDMLTGSLVIYILADLREIAREKGTLSELEPPLTTSHILGCIQENKQELEERAVDHEELAKRLLAFHQVEESSQTDSFLASLFAQTSKKNLNDSMPVLTHFDDRNAEQEIVHAIVVNHARRRISVAFRGSVTQQDFIQDAKCAQTKVANPVYRLSTDASETTETISLHAGFYEYITKEDPETNVSRLEVILNQTKELLKSYPGYQVFCTGHSLGGALCTLFGFFAAADDEILAGSEGKPVVIYSFASPYCGNWKFRYAFVHLERLGRLQHLRTANLEDMVTLLPFFAPKATLLSPLASAVMGAGNLYRHVGIRLQLADRAGGPIHTFAYPKDYQSNDEDYAQEVKDSLQAGKSLAKALYSVIRNDFNRVKKHHSCIEYEKRLEMCRELLASVTLSRLYSDKTIVGKLLEEDYKPILASGGERARRAVGFWASRRPSSAEDAQSK